MYCFQPLHLSGTSRARQLRSQTSARRGRCGTWGSHAEPTCTVPLMSLRANPSQPQRMSTRDAGPIGYYAIIPVCAYHFCMADNQSTLAPATFVRNIASQLCVTVSGFAVALAKAKEALQALLGTECDQDPASSLV